VHKTVKSRQSCNYVSLCAILTYTDIGYYSHSVVTVLGIYYSIHNMPNVAGLSVKHIGLQRVNGVLVQ